MNWKGKPLSLAAKLLAVIFVVAAVSLKALGIFKEITVWEILGTGAFLMLVFSPVDFSLILKRIEAIIVAKASGQPIPPDDQSASPNPAQQQVGPANN